MEKGQQMSVEDLQPVTAIIVTAPIKRRSVAS